MVNLLKNFIVVGMAEILIIIFGRGMQWQENHDFPISGDITIKRR